MSYLAAAFGGYLAGSIPSGYWLVRLARGIDIRRVGSGSIGATNVWRAVGWKYGLAVILVDVGKGFVPAVVARLAVDDLAGAVAGAAAMVGHSRPLFLRLERGGKIVATTGGVLLALAPLVAVAAAAVWALVFLLVRYVSVASIAGAMAVPAFAFAFRESWAVRALALGAAAAVVLLHRANVARLRAGREPRVRLRAIFSR